MIIWLLSFNLLIWCITLIYLHILKNPCISGINPTWSWCMSFLMCCWSLFARILLRIFASMFISDIGLWFYFFCCLCPVLVSAWLWPHRRSLEMFLPLQYFGRFSEKQALALLLVFDRIPLQSYLAMGFCVLGDFYYNLYFRVCNWLVHNFYFFPVQSLEVELS